LSGSLRVVYGEVFLKHRTPRGHPERPERLEIALSALLSAGVPFVTLSPQEAEPSLLRKVHVEEYIKTVELLSRSAPTSLDEDTYVSEGTLEAALHAVGAAAQAARLSWEARAPVLALVRSPGHHAGRSGAAMGAPSLGFCIFNNVAAARFAVPAKRVCILDFDAHHGNGTQEIFYEDPSVLHVGLHQDPLTLYPGTGFLEDVGRGEGEGTKVNIVLPPGSGDDVLKVALETVVAPVVEQFKPELVLVSAGFDAYAGDGLADLRLTSSSFYELGLFVGSGRWPVAAVLEGGYSVGLRKGLPAFASGLLRAENPVRDARTSSGSAFSSARSNLERLRRLLRKYWEV